MLDDVGDGHSLELFRTVTPLAVQPGERLETGPVRSPFAKGRVGEGFVQPSLVPLFEFSQKMTTQSHPSTEGVVGVFARPFEF